MKPTLIKLHAKIKNSISKHGEWDDYDLRKMWVKVQDEIKEVLIAEEAGDLHSEHGVASELLDVAVCCVKMSMQITRRHNAKTEKRPNPVGGGADSDTGGDAPLQ